MAEIEIVLCLQLSDAKLLCRKTLKISRVPIVGDRFQSGVCHLADIDYLQVISVLFPLDFDSLPHIILEPIDLSDFESKDIRPGLEHHGFEITLALPNGNP